MGVLCVIACGQSEPLLRLNLPVEGTHQSALIAITPEPGADMVFWVLDLDAPMPAMTGFRTGSDVEVTALLFTQAVADLGLSPGPLTLAAPHTVSRRLPRAHRLVSTEVIAGQAGSWNPLPALPAALAEARLSSSPKCQAISAVPIPWQTDARLRWITPWRPADASNPTHGLVGLNDGSVHTLSMGQGLALSWSGAAVPIDAAHPGPDGTVLHSVGEGEIWIARPDPEVARFASQQHGLMAAHFRSYWMSGPPEIEEAVYLLATEWHSGERADNGHLVRYHLSGEEGGSLHYFPPEPGRPKVNEGDLAWVGSDEVVALWPYADDHVTRYVRGDVHTELLPQPRQVEHVDGWGTIVSSEDGRLFYRRDAADSWQVIANHDRRIDRLVAGASRLWLVDEDNQLLLLVPNIGLCEQRATLDLSVDGLVVLPEGVVVVGRSQGTTEARWVSL